MSDGFDKKNIGRILIIILFVGILVYGFIESKALRNGVHVEVFGIENGATYTEPLLEISGNALHATSLTVNGQGLPIEESGAWKHQLLLLPGYNIITIVAVDKFKKDDWKQYKVYLDAPPISLDKKEPESVEEPSEEIQSEIITNYF